MFRLYLLVFSILLCGSAFAQCNNSIELRKVVVDKSLSNNGVIEISVSTPGSYTCVLNSEKGSGPEKISEKNGSGTGVVRFQNLDKRLIYQVVFEFVSEKEPLCKKLQKSKITLE